MRIYRKNYHRLSYLLALKFLSLQISTSIEIFGGRHIEQAFVALLLGGQAQFGPGNAEFVQQFNWQNITQALRLQLYIGSNPVSYLCSVFSFLGQAPHYQLLFVRIYRS